MAKATANKDLNIFAKRLGELIRDKGCTHETVAKAAEVTRQGVGKWVSGENVPDVLTTAKIARFFNVSVDYLAGISDIKSVDADLKSVCDFTGLSEKSVRLCSSLRQEKEYREEEQRFKQLCEGLIDENYRKRPPTINIISAMLEVLDDYKQMLSDIGSASVIDLNDEDDIDEDLINADSEKNPPSGQSIADRIYRNGTVLTGYDYKRYLVQGVVDEGTQFFRDLINRLTPREYLYRDDDGGISDISLDTRHKHEVIGLLEETEDYNETVMNHFVMYIILMIDRKVSNGIPLDPDEMKWQERYNNTTTYVGMYDLVEEWREKIRKADAGKGKKKR